MALTKYQKMKQLYVIRFKKNNILIKFMKLQDITYKSDFNPHSYDMSERKLYEKACRGEVKPSEKIIAKLKCKYVDNNVPFLKIAPFKMEEAYLDPYIVIYIDVMSDNEIEVVKRLAKPKVSF